MGAVDRRVTLLALDELRRFSENNDANRPYGLVIEKLRQELQ